MQANSIDQDRSSDINGRAYAGLSACQIGSRLEADGGGTCMNEGEILAVYQDKDGDMAVPCSEGGHCLDGQADDGEHLVGLYPIA